MAKVLSINSGSSSMKISLFEMPAEKCLAKILIDYADRKNQKAVLTITDQKEIYIDHFSKKMHPIELTVKLLKKQGLIKDAADIFGIGHRIVAGGEVFTKSTEITESMLTKLNELTELAPLHNPANIAGIHEAEKLFPHCRQVAVFDTSFHTSLPPENYLYAIPLKYYHDYKVRKYGAHGTSHRYVAQQAAQMLKKPIDSLKLITLHLGSGASAAAIKDGKSLDTSMGFSPVSGLMMSTRSGDIDPSALAFLLDHGAFKDIDDCLNILNHHAGILGVSKISRDMREVQEKIKTDPKADLAVKMFVKKICDYIGAYWIELGGADAIVFTGGIGENDCVIRDMICHKLACLGIKFQPHYNQEHRLPFDFSAEDSSARLLAIPTNEELMIARDTFAIVKKQAATVQTEELS
jgi:acetate kinase